MIKVGIDKLAIYTPRFKLDLATLAKQRGVDADKFNIGLGQWSMSVPPPGEDIVTMGANAAHEVIKDIDPNDIELLLLATESGIDQSKSAGVFIHELLHLSPRCRTIELKQACYSATAAIQLALPFLREHPQKKILVIASDIARYGLETPGESSQGAAAIALLLSANPRLLAIEPEYGIITESVMDFWRPNYRHEALVDGKYSSKLYLSMLEKTWQQYHDLSKRSYADHAYFCFHAPVPRLVEKAHQYLRKLNGVEGTNDPEVSYSLKYSREIGNSYTASLYVCLASLLEHAPENLAGKRVGFYSYGSGCVAEYFSGIVQNNYRDVLYTQYHRTLIQSRQNLSYDEYEKYFSFVYAEDGSEQTIPIYATQHYRLAEIKKHKRIYIENNLVQSNITNSATITPLYPNEKKKFTAKQVQAPGKLILSGEHAVVYGMPALVMAIDKYVKATVTQEPEQKVSFDLTDIAHSSHLSFQALKSLKNKIKNKYHRFIRGEYSIREVLQKPFELAQFALSLITETSDITTPKGINVKLQSDIPIGCGLGSSAATILSVMQAIANYLELPITQEELYKNALEAENMQHGLSSGIDIRIALQGGCLYLHGDKIEARPVLNLPIYLVNTGKPENTTGQCVEKVAPLFKSHQLRNDFAQVTQSMDQALQQQSQQLIQETVRANHQLLASIGVVPLKVQHFIHEIEKNGAAGKICGAGAISGNQAGAVMITGANKNHILTLCEKYNYQLLPISGVTRGVHAA